MDWAKNTIKLRRITDKMQGASEEAIKAEYIKQGGLLLEELTFSIESLESGLTNLHQSEEPLTTNIKESKVKKAVKKVVKAVKKVTKK